MSQIDPFDEPPPQARKRFVPTSHLMIYLTTVLTWEAQILILLVRFIKGVRVHPVWEFAVLCLCILLTVLAIRVGKHNLQYLFYSRGRIELSGMQALLVTVMFVSFGITIGVAYDWFR